MGQLFRLFELVAQNLSRFVLWAGSCGSSCGCSSRERLWAPSSCSPGRFWWVQARALACLDDEAHGEAVTEIREGIVEIEAFLEKIGQLDQLDDCPELLFLREWETEVESNRPRSPRERLAAELQAAVEADKFELAASLRDRLRSIETEQSGQEL